MADPLSVTASVLAVVTAAVVSVRSLCDTIKSFQNRNSTLKRLQHILRDLATILNSLTTVISADASVVALLEGPIDRCQEICTEFEQSMRRFHGKSKTGLLDWTKLEFMRGDINDFIDTIEGYKSTITVGIGTITLRNSTVSLEVLHQYEEVIKDATYNLQIHLQRIDEKLAQHKIRENNVVEVSLDLQDEKVVTQQCLRIGQDARSYIESLGIRESGVLRGIPQSAQGENTFGEFEAQAQVRQAFSTSQAALSDVISSLGERLRSVIAGKSDNENEQERLRLQDDLNISKQCLEVCKIAGEVNHQKIHTIGEAIAEDNSDQVVVTTLADLFDVKKAVSKGHSAQLVATLTPDNFDRVISERYSSRFGVPAGPPVDSHVTGVTSSGLSETHNAHHLMSLVANQDRRSATSEVRRDKPNPNEMKRRYGDSNSDRKPTPSRD